LYVEKPINFIDVGYGVLADKPVEMNFHQQTVFQYFFD